MSAGQTRGTLLQRRGQTCCQHPQHPAQLAAHTGMVTCPKAHAMGMGFSGHCLLSLHSNWAGFATAGLLIYLACLCGEWILHGGKEHPRRKRGSVICSNGGDWACRWMGQSFL